MLVLCLSHNLELLTLAFLFLGDRCIQLFRSSDVDDWMSPPICRWVEILSGSSNNVRSCWDVVVFRLFLGCIEDGRTNSSSNLLQFRTLPSLCCHCFAWKPKICHLILNRGLLFWCVLVMPRPWQILLLWSLMVSFGYFRWINFCLTFGVWGFPAPFLGVRKLSNLVPWCIVTMAMGMALALASKEQKKQKKSLKNTLLIWSSLASSNETNPNGAAINQKSATSLEDGQLNVNKESTTEAVPLMKTEKEEPSKPQGKMDVAIFFNKLNKELKKFLLASVLSLV